MFFNRSLFINRPVASLRVRSVFRATATQRVVPLEVVPYVFKPSACLTVDVSLLYVRRDDRDGRVQCA